MGKQGTKRQPGYKEAINSKYYHIVKPLLDKNGIRVRKWTVYDEEAVYWADFDTNIVVLPIPDCSWSLYVCLHEIGHLVKGSRMHSYLQEYHAELYALEKMEKLNLRGHAAKVKRAKHYVQLNLLQDIIFHDLSPNSVRREVRSWLGVTPKRLRSLALKRCSMILSHILTEHSTDPFTKISRDEKQKVKQRKQEIYEIEGND